MVRFCSRVNVRFSTQRDENLAGSPIASGMLSADFRKLRPCLASDLDAYTSAVLLNTLPPYSPRHSQLASKLCHDALLRSPTVKLGLALPSTTLSSSDGFVVWPLAQSGLPVLHANTCCPCAFTNRN